jgi:hypothetical protein
LNAVFKKQTVVSIEAAEFSPFHSAHGRGNWLSASAHHHCSGKIIVQRASGWTDGRDQKTNTERN